MTKTTAALGAALAMALSLSACSRSETTGSVALSNEEVLNDDAAVDANFAADNVADAPVLGNGALDNGAALDGTLGNDAAPGNGL